MVDVASTTGDLQEDLQRLHTFLHLTNSVLCYTPRETNSVAHHLACYGLQASSMSTFHTLENLPGIAQGCVLTDLSTAYLRA